MNDTCLRVWRPHGTILHKFKIGEAFRAPSHISDCEAVVSFDAL